MPVEIRTRTAPPARGAPGEIDSLFVPTIDAGLDEVTEVRSIGDYEAAGATRQGDPAAYDGLDNYFREGGRRAWVSPGADLDESLTGFTENMGGGQVVQWAGVPDAASYGALQDFAASTQRFALMDVPQSADTVAGMVTAGGLLPDANDEYGACFGPWVNIPAPAGVIGGSTRTVPASSTVAGLIARSDSLGNPNRAPAGRDFPLQYATSTTGGLLTDVDTQALREAGVNPLRNKFNLLVLDGFQNAIDSDPDNPFWQANCSRARMWLQWQALSVGLNYEYKTIDGKGRLARRLGTDLEAVCKALWDVDGLFGASPQEAYHVETGASINTEQTTAYGELWATVEAKFSLHARRVVIELVTVPITGRVNG